MRTLWVCAAAVCVLCLVAENSFAQGDLETPQLTEVRVPSSVDQTDQPLRMWAPTRAKEKPTALFVMLHTWSGDYRQDRSEWLREAAARDWIFVQPNFRGPNRHPEACGSARARADVLDAIDWAVANYQVDTERVYLAGVSGGGHMAMLLAAYHPERFSAVSAWVGISNLTDWYEFHTRDGKLGNYAKMIAASCGGAPGTDAGVDVEYYRRSPIHFLQYAAGLPLDLNAGVTDGKSGSVPMHHTLRAFNVLARAVQAPEVSDEEMQQLWSDERLRSPHPADIAEDPLYGREIRLRRFAGATRVTIFDGGHEGIPAAGVAWLEGQSRATTPSSAGLLP